MQVLVRIHGEILSCLRRAEPDSLFILDVYRLGLFYFSGLGMLAYAECVRSDCHSRYLRWRNLWRALLIGLGESRAMVRLGFLFWRQ